jgi:hypothetical protein
MMVSTVVTLLVILAMAQAFAMIGVNVESKRAMVEMSTQLRNMGNRFHEDLSGLTVPARPWPTRSAGEGMLELIEGPMTDATPLVAAAGLPPLLGDLDDMVFHTSRRVDSSFIGKVALPGPDGGWGVFNVDDDNDGTIDNFDEVAWPGSDDLITIDGQVAEVAWYALGVDEDAPIRSTFTQPPPPAVAVPTFDPTEYSVHRRELLVRPDLAPGANGLIGTFAAPSTNQGDLRVLAINLRRFFKSNDTSVRKRIVVSGGRVLVSVFANTLADLSQRENRFGHYPVLAHNIYTGSYAIVNGGIDQRFPFPVEEIFATPPRSRVESPLISRIHDFPRSVTAPRMLSVNFSTDPIDGSLLIRPDAETMVANNVVSFDLKVYDPSAAIRVHPGPDGAWGGLNVDDDNDGITDNMTEAGWPTTDDSDALTHDMPLVQAIIANGGNINVATPVIGFGAYMDLNYAGTTGLSVFSGPRTVRSRAPASLTPSPTPLRMVVSTYDTWSYFYEIDGVNQNANSGNFAGNRLDDNNNNAVDEGAEANMPIIDEGANARDDNGVNGPDDPLERETAPPYEAPLRGMQARLRVYEPDTRQVRQISVGVDFLPE